MSGEKDKEISENDVTSTEYVKGKGKGKTSNDEEKVADLKADTTGHFEDLAEQSKKNLLSGGENVKIDLIKTVDVRFTKDIGHIKKGHTQKLSQTAYDIYKKKEAVELI